MTMVRSLALSTALVFGSAPVAVAQAPLLEQMRAQGHARIAVANEPPITEVKPDGTVTGAAVEVARAVLREMGVPDISATVTPFSGMIPGCRPGASTW